MNWLSLPILALLTASVCSKTAAAADFNPTKWMDLWEEIPATKLPALTPDGTMQSLELALVRQIVNCKEYEKGEFQHCSSEPQLEPVECDIPVLEKMHSLLKKSKNWKSYYDKAKKEFVWYRYKGTTPGQTQFTGYNAPLFEGSVRPDSRFRYPLYSRPADLVNEAGPDGRMKWGRKLANGSIVPYDSHKMIDVDMSLAGKGLEIAYMEFPSDIQRLHIEGSGIFRVRDGNATRDLVLNYAGKNGQPFASVFKVLKEKGVDKKYMTFPGLKQYFIDFPDQMWPTLITNPSYVFFSLGTEPPCGTVRAYLTPGHSLATDPVHLPLGMPVFVEAARPVEGTDPNSPTAPTKPFTRFALSQDTGGAIKQAHVDVYWGSDQYAMLASNLMNSRGNLYIPKLRKMMRMPNGK